MTRYLLTHIFRFTILTSCLFAANSMPFYLVASPPALAAPLSTSVSHPSSPNDPIQNLYNALQKAEAGVPDIQQRRIIIGSAVDQAFDVNAIVRRSIGLRYNHLSDEERTEVINAFRNFTVARYASAFKPGANAIFTISPTPHNTSPNNATVQTTVRGKSDPVSDATKLDYVMSKGPQGWRIIDILIDGHISQVGAQRSDFKTIFSQSGARGLTKSLNQKADNFLHE